MINHLLQDPNFDIADVKSILNAVDPERLDIINRLFQDKRISTKISRS